MKTDIFKTIFFAFLICLAGCSEKSNKVKSSKGAYELSQSLWTDYQTDLKKGNPTEIGQNFADDAKIVYPDTPEIMGEENIHNTLSAMFPKFQIVEFDFVIEDCFQCDSLLFSYITVNEKYKMGSTDYESVARISSIWKLSFKNEWKIRLFHINYRNK